MQRMTWHLLNPTEPLNLTLTLLCGQAFRWHKIAATNEWVGVLQDKLIRLKQADHHDDGKNEKVYFWHENPNSCSNEIHHYKSMLSNYFSLDVNLNNLLTKWNEDFAFERHCSHLINFPQQQTENCHQFGLRLLRQDPLETLFAFICSSNNHIDRIAQMVNNLANFYGEEVGEYFNQKYFSFPTINSLLKNKSSLEKTLRANSFGYRAKFIYQTTNQLEKLGGICWLNSLREKSYEETIGELTKLAGVGQKVADCIALHGLGFWETIPIDTHIHQIAQRLYFNNSDNNSVDNKKKNKNLSKINYCLIRKFLQQKWTPFAGWAQTIVFCADLKKFQQKTDKSGRKRRKEDVQILGFSSSTGAVPVPVATAALELNSKKKRKLNLEKS